MGHPRLALSLSVAFILFRSVLASPAQEPPPQRAPAEPAGTGRISGQVVAADNGTPVKRAIVSLASRPAVVTGGGRRGAPPQTGVRIEISSSGFPSSSQPAETTDEAGRFEFSDLAAGQYSLMVAPQGGFVRLQRSHTVEVKEGGTATVTIRLERTGAITGRVLDESGDPLPRARVTALRRQTIAQTSRLMATGPAVMTDDLGQFRLFDLEPGAYYVSAAYMDARMGGPGTPTVGYAPTYFPGAPTVAAAKAVTVGSGQETPGIDFSLARVSMGRISGTVRDSSGQVVSGNAGVNVTPLRDDSGGFNRGSSVRPDGSYAIYGIPPGEYYLSASLYRNAPNGSNEGVYVPVTVSGDEQQIHLQLNKGATLAGRVVIEGTPPVIPAEIAARMPQERLRISVSARPIMFSAPPGAMAGGRPATVDDDGTFELTNLRGAIVLNAFGYRAALKSITIGGRDYTARPIELKGTEQRRDVTIVLTTDVGSIVGVVANDRGEPAAEAFVIAFPDNTERWYPGSPFIYISRGLPVLATSAMSAPVQRPGMPPPPPRVPGGFSLSQLVPGRYLVVAIESAMGTPSPPTDRDTLEKLRGRATLVTVEAGQAATVQLRAVKSF